MSRSVDRHSKIVVQSVKNVRQLSWYSDFPMGWTVMGSYPDRGKRFLTYKKPPDGLWDPSNLLFRRYGRPFAGKVDGS
jgi:hypothetical protein